MERVASLYRFPSSTALQDDDDVESQAGDDDADIDEEGGSRIPYCIKYGWSAMGLAILGSFIMYCIVNFTDYGSTTRAGSHGVHALPPCPADMVMPKRESTWSALYHAFDSKPACDASLEPDSSTNSLINLMRNHNTDAAAQFSQLRARQKKRSKVGKDESSHRQ